MPLAGKRFARLFPEVLQGPGPKKLSYVPEAQIGEVRDPLLAAPSRQIAPLAREGEISRLHPAPVGIPVAGEHHPAAARAIRFDMVSLAVGTLAATHSIVGKDGTHTPLFEHDLIGEDRQFTQPAAFQRMTDVELQPVTHHCQGKRNRGGQNRDLGHRFPFRISSYRQTSADVCW